jgi:hypothetical protein
MITEDKTAEGKLHDRVFRIKGYGFTSSEEKKCELCSELLSKNGQCKTDCMYRFRTGVHTATGKSVSIQIITTLSEYIQALDNIETTYADPVFYRGQLNCSYALLPSAYRKKNLEREKLLYDEFERHFPEEMKHCTNAMERLEFMQHYDIPTRAFDISESPLLALYFACSPMEKFKTESGLDHYWGEVILFRGNKDSIKYPDDDAVSVLANTGFCNKEFSLGHVEQKYMREHPSAMLDYIYLKDILCRSIIVRTKQDNPRIRNQRGAFIMMNANEWVNIDHIGTDFEKKFSCSIKSLKKDIDGDPEINLEQLKEQHSAFKNAVIWDFCFKKINPYMCEDNPFDLEKLYYRNNKKEQIIFLIPPCIKKHLKEQLQHLGITEAFVYPELDSVAHELNLNYWP